MSIEIPLRDGLVALIDEADADLIQGWKFHLVPLKRLNYARGSTPSEKMKYLHRIIMNAPDGMEVDHINHNGLDCRRENLRIVSHQQNMRHRRMNHNTNCPYTGVRIAGSSGKWTSRIKINGVHLYLGTFDTPEQALRVRNAKAIELFGEFAMVQDEKAA